MDQRDLQEFKEWREKLTEKERKKMQRSGRRLEIIATLIIVIIAFIIAIATGNLNLLKFLK